MTCEPIVIGATCDDQINYGETVDLLFTYTDENGDPVDLSSATPAIFSSSPDVIKADTEITVADAAAGKVRFLLDRTSALSLRKGRNNRFRLQVIFGADSDDVTPDIYLQVT
ncbi:hypothetical protein GCM10007989_07280 [Devosia pacifica]|uniref:Uncharacterized protein n=1 Tax=Devosia pacifica TaxID=1335967 RepID=A0A918RZU8_9HYPH|nr:hypothetical protein [Devosia pacifica]GHA15071.1 hypothetical protein GCM10007989_07280 [Devosia pacifica]